MTEDIGNRSRPATTDCSRFEPRGGVVVQEFEDVVNELLREMCDHLELMGRTQGYIVCRDHFRKDRTGGVWLECLG